MPEPRAPMRPDLATGDKVSRNILRDLDKIQKLRPPKQLILVENLIYYIVISLRKTKTDNLLQTTTIWALINLLAVDEDISRHAMLSAGIPGVLYDIMASDTLAGSTRQYASELCHFLCSTDPFPQAPPIPVGGPMGMMLPVVQTPVASNDLTMEDAVKVTTSSADSYAGSSAQSDISSANYSNRRKGLAPFVPYRIDDDNVHAINALFDYGGGDVGFEGKKQKSLRAATSGSFTKSHSSHGLRADKRKKPKLHPLDAPSTISSWGSFDGELSHDGGLSQDPTIRSPIKPNHSSLYPGGFDLNSSIATYNTNATDMSSCCSSSLKSLKLPSKVAKSGVERRSLIRDKTHAFDAYTSHWNNSEGAGEAEPQYENNSDDFAPSPHNAMFRLKPVISNSFAANVFEPSESQSLTDIRCSTSVASSRRSYELDAGSFTGITKPGTTGGMSSAASAGQERFPMAPQDRHMLAHAAHSSARSVNSQDTKQSHRMKGKVRPKTETFIEDMDPLALNVTAGFQARFDTYNNGAGAADSDSEEEQEENSFYQDPNALTGTAGTEEERSAAHVEAVLTKRRQRIRAEKLVDMEFTKRLFIDKATMQDSQDLIHRMESILELLDPSNSGFVSWETFAKVLLSVAPPHLLRANVVAFLDAQSEDKSSLIDYKEFMISGKVMIIEKEVNDKLVLPVKGWLERQKQMTGDASTHTWKNHMEWYRQRKSDAVIWLMRCATKGLQQSTKSEAALKFLIQVGYQSKAKTFLMNVGSMAIAAEAKRLEAKKNLLRRSIKARRWNLYREEARKFLLYCGRYTEELAAYKKRREELKELGMMPKPKLRGIQAGYENLYDRHQTYQRTIGELRVIAKRSLDICTRQDNDAKWLYDFAQVLVNRYKLIEDTQQWLEDYAAKMHIYCVIKDNTLMSLMRIGTKAYNYLVRQEDALAWLLDMAERAESQCKVRDSMAGWLINYGQRKLIFLNNRENAFAILNKRTEMAVDLVGRREIAIAYLQRIPKAFYHYQKQVERSFVWLSELGRAAASHKSKQMEAFVQLRYKANHASVAFRKTTLAFTDLRERGQFAKYELFRKVWSENIEYSDRIVEEKRLVELAERRVNQSRAGLEAMTRWKMELKDVFDWMIKITAQPPQARAGDNGEGGEDGDTGKAQHGRNSLGVSVMGRYSIARLLLFGKLLGQNKQVLEEFCSHVDIVASGTITFDELWHWLEFELQHYVPASKGSLGKTLASSMGSLKLNGTQPSTADQSDAADEDVFNNTGNLSNSGLFGSTFNSFAAKASTKKDSYDHNIVEGKKAKKFHLNVSTILSVEDRAFITLYKRHGAGGGGGGGSGDDDYLKEYEKSKKLLAKKRNQADDDDDEIDLREYDYDF